MQPNTRELLDVNIVVVLDTPVAKFNEAPALFQRDELAAVLRPPLNIDQGLVLEAGRGPSVSVDVESMRSQKSVKLSSSRLEVHDRSGADILNTDLAVVVSTLAVLLDIDKVKAVGVNIEYTVQASADWTAAREIAHRFIRSESISLPEGIEPRGGTVRLYLGRGDEVTYTIVVEPRYGDAKSSLIWMSCNAHRRATEMPSSERLKEFVIDAHDLLKDLINSSTSRTIEADQ